VAVRRGRLGDWLIVCSEVTRQEHKMRPIRFALAAAVVVALATGHAPSNEQKKQPPAKPKEKQDPKSAQAKLMAEKLHNAQKLLEGLATNNFRQIEKSADELMTISKAAEFTNARKTAKYEVQMNNFRRSLEEITRKAKEKNLDGATLGYVDMTLTCVRCHQYTREEADARLPLPGLGGDARTGE
jgi:hypothetical protein